MKRLEEYSSEEVKKFNYMHEVLKEYNKLMAEGIDPILLPGFSDSEMMEYSRYRELLLSNQCEDQ